MTKDEREDWLWWQQQSDHVHKCFEIYEPFIGGAWPPGKWCVNSFRRSMCVSSAYFDSSRDAVWHIYNTMKNYGWIKDE